MSGDDTDVVVHEHSEVLNDTDDEMVYGQDDQGEQEEAEEEASDDTETEDEPDDQDESQDESDETDSEGSDEEEQPQGKDKALTKLQQRQTTLERQLNERFNGISEQLDKLSKLADAIESRGGEPTKRQEQQVENVRDELGELLDGDDDDFIDKKTLKTILGQISGKKSDPADLQAEVRKLYEAEKKAESDRQKAVQEYLRKEAEDFDDMYPEIAGQYPDLSKRASDEVNKRFGNLKAEDYERKYNMLFAKMSAEASQKALAKEQPSKARPAGNKPPKSAKGANTKPVGASAKKGNDNGVVFHDNDMDKALYDLSPDD